MRRLAIVLGLLLLGTPALAQETWYFISGSGAQCAPGAADYLLSETNGSSLATENVASPGDNWSVVEARSIAAGDWSFQGRYDVGSGGGAGPQIDVTVRRYNTSCALQETIVTWADVDLTKEGAAELINVGPTSVGQIDFSSGDILAVTVVRTRGTVSIVQRFNGASGLNTSFLTHPAEVVVGGRRVMRVD